ncbi:hypothetical protein OG455_16525 [Kitasatospora sp. NBC_01287]|uniref:hypothetical protein n=1 Tax=Kitasatospora sp. NBC_01287 TaxID=2903573 RepID=UPI00224CDFDD|nr:hypothetical protein [Kitasatospora sp. NBC_01287]MCX4747105.1 hypothetical protein [Kitasatospora sp. NBC_01287]
MSDAIPSYGFTAARKGYAPEQVDRALAALTGQRDHAWHRLSQLGAQIRELETALAAAREAAAQAPEPDYTTLSEQAGDLMAIAENEARQIREKSERSAEDTRDGAAEAGRRLQAEAAAFATATREDADQSARRTDERTRAEAEKLRAEADQDARTIRDTATADAARLRVEAAEAGERAETRLAELRRDADERFAAEDAAAAAEDAKVSLAAERRLKEAEQHRESVLGLIKQTDTDAQAKADQLIETARREAERTNVATAAERAEFDKRLETVQTHLDHIKGTLASLTGKAVGMIEPGEFAAGAAARAAAAGADPEADTGEVPLPAVPPAAAPAAPAGSPATQAGGADAPTTVLRLPAELLEATAVTPQPQPAAVDPRSALHAAGAARPPLPPRPATPPPAARAAAPAEPTDPAAETAVMPRFEAAPGGGAGAVAAAANPASAAGNDETAIIPKIVIIDDGTALDSLPNTVGRRRS